MQFFCLCDNDCVKFCLLLHFYQPSNQFGDVIKKVTQESYIPLIKLLKTDKRLRVTADFPLSLLEQLDRYGFAWLIRDIKDLVQAGRIELVGSAAYHPLLTKIPQDFAEKQIILNEESLAYYYGARKDFEGEDCFMIKGLKGFFPPEMSINQDVLALLEGLGYDWVLADEVCLPDSRKEKLTEGFVYTVGDQHIKLIIRDRGLTDLISFKRDLDKSSIVANILKDSSDKLVALDAETFGHHYRDGLDLLESITSDLVMNSIDISTISEVVQDAEVGRVPSITETTWSSVDKATYPLWENPLSTINTELWLLQKEVHTAFSRMYPEPLKQLIGDQGGGVAVWRHSYDLSIPAPDQRTQVELTMLKLEQSDQFWWSAEAEVMGKRNFSRYMVDSVLDYYVAAINNLGSDGALLERVNVIRALLKG